MFYIFTTECDLPAPTAGATTTYNDLKVGSSLTFSCQPGAITAGYTPIITCQEDGSWSSTTFECRKYVKMVYPMSFCKPFQFKITK